MDNDDLDRRFSSHDVDGGQVALMGILRDRARQLADDIDRSMPDGREKSTAITKLEEAVFWANAGISRA